MKPGRKEKLTPRDITWARARWRGAMTVKDLAWALQVSQWTVRSYAKKYGFGPHPGDRNPPKAGEPIPTLWACEKCGCRSAQREGHPQCVEAA